MILYPNSKPPGGFLILLRYDEDDCSQMYSNTISTLDLRCPWNNYYLSDYTLLEVLRALSDLKKYSFDLDCSPERLYVKTEEIRDILLDDLSINYVYDVAIYPLAHTQSLNIEELVPNG